MGTLPASLWQEVIDARSCSRNPTVYFQNQLRTGEAVGRPLTAEAFDPRDSFWSAASRSGARVAMLDVPYAHIDPDLNGVQLVEWGVHDPEFGHAVAPSAFADEIRSKYGPHPISQKYNGRCDHYPKNTAGYLELLNDLLSGLERRTKLYTDVIKRENWDLAVCGYTEAHCAGHHFFHFHNNEHYAHDRSAPEPLKSGLLDVYRGIDKSLSEVMDAAGSDATVLLFAPQGMQDFTGGFQMLPEILARLGLASDNGKAGKANLVRHAQNLVKTLAPKSLVAPLRRLTKLGVVSRLQADAGCMLDPFTSPNTKAATVPNNRIGAIRLNLKGREPFGAVDMSEKGALIDEIRRELMALRHPKSGETIVKSIQTAEEAFGREHHPDVPDLVVEFRTDVGPIEECVSPRVGHIRVPFGKMLNRRTGDHTTNARLWAMGKGIESGATHGQSDILDIGPTTLALLKANKPNHMDGHALGWVAR
jgi:predicted AlkP superfamily phosphohydrolase/phosphomutase